MIEKQKKEEAANASRTEDMTTSQQTTGIKTINPKTSKKDREREKQSNNNQQTPNIWSHPIKRKQ